MPNKIKDIIFSNLRGINKMNKLLTFSNAVCCSLESNNCNYIEEDLKNK